MKQQFYNTALYMRLSRDDEQYGDSVSIETQRTILRQYAAENHLNVVGEYVDDGWSGTNFDRPDFKRMMADVDDGKINCIVTKDLSRFGREHVQMGFYLEFEFPKRGIRYIAVTDNEDTSKGLSDFVPFKTLFNEFYAKDTSRKVKASFKAKFANGERIFSYAPIGYKRRSDMKNKLEIDEDTRWIVEKIYSLAVQGAGAAKICRTLIQEKVPTPGWLNYQRYGTFANIYANQPEEKTYAWTVSQVKKILKDETYIGNTIHYRQTNISYKNKKRILRDASEWVRVENTQEAIISKDVFEQVQEQIAHRHRQRKDATTQIFAGLLRCADCGWSMNFSTNRQNKTPFSYYSCTFYRQPGKTCTSHYVRYDALYSFVLSRLQYWAYAVQQDEKAILERLSRSNVTEQATATRRAAQEKKRVEKRLAQLDNLMAKIYEDRLTEVITPRNFTMLSEKYQKEQEEQERRLEMLDAQLKDTRQKTENVDKWLDLVKQYSNITELTAELLNALIEKIVVHEAIKDGDGKREQEIEIFYRFVGNIDQANKSISLIA